MKRIISLIVTLAMLASMFSINAFAAGFEALPEGSVAGSTVRFGLISDSHIQVADGKTASDQTAAFERALSAYANLDIDVLVLAGDIIMLSGSDTTADKMTPEYNALKTSLAKYGFSTKVNSTDVEAGKIPVIYATGNHEFPVNGNSAACQTAIATFKSEMDCEQNSHTVINGIHFITSGGSSYGSYAYTDATDDFDNESYMKQEIEKAVAATPDSPVFLVIHHPMYETVQSSQDTGNHRYTTAFKDWLNTQPNVIELSAHTHVGVDEATSVWQDGFTVVNSGYVGGSNASYSQGYVVEANSSTATFYKMDFIGKTYISEPWVVNVKDLSTYAVSGRVNAKAPVFPENAKITVSGIESEKATISWSEANQTATGAYQDDYVDAYTLKVSDANDGTVVFDTTYEFYGNSIKQTTSAEVTGLAEYTKYNVEVTATSPLGNVSKALTTTFTTLDPALKRDYMVFECEANGVVNNNEAVNEGSDKWIVNQDASGGVYVRSNINKWTWDFTPEKTAYYRFEVVGNGDKCTENGSFMVGSTQLWNGVWNTTPSWDCTGAYALTTKLGDSILLNAGTTYKLELKPRGSTPKTITLDYFKIYCDDTRTVTSNSIDTTIGYAGLYGVDIVGYGSNDAKATVTVSETVNGIANTVITTDAVELNGTEGTSAGTDKVGIFYMDEGDKTVTVNVTGDYNIEKISVYKMLDVKTYGTHIEAEKYTTSTTKAFTALYGDYTNSMFASGLCGENINATYSFTATADQTYRFDVIGAAEATASNVAITVNGTTINGKIKSGDWQTKSVYIGDIELTKGDYTITLTADNAVKLNALKVSRGLGNMDMYFEAEDCFDAEAGQNVGYYDTTPNGHDDQWQIRDTYGFVDVYGADGGWTSPRLYMLNREWFRYTVDIPRAGYYRVLLKIKSSDAPMSVTVNDVKKDVTVSRTATMANYIKEPWPYDNAGLFWFNEGKNLVKIAHETNTGSIQFDAFRIVSPDIEFAKFETGKTIKLNALDYYESVNSGINGNRLTLDAPYNHPSYPRYITWKVNFERTGNYGVSLYGSGNSGNKGYILLDGNIVTDEVDFVGNASDWGERHTTDFETIYVEAGEHLLTLAPTKYPTYYAEYITITEPDGYVPVKTANEGVYNAVVDVTDWYAGVTHNSANANYTQWINWQATSDEMQELAVVVSVYEGDMLVNAYFSNTILETTNVTNSNLKDYKITIEDIVIEDGQYVKLFLLDNGTMTPLADYTIYQ